MIREISEIQTILNHSHDTDPDYFPPEVNKVRLYVFQIHANYERSAQALITVDYLKVGSIYQNELLFAQITFEGKMKILESNHAQFPLKTAKKLNILRNEFAHKRGAEIRDAYSITARLHKLYKFLGKANNELNDFWVAWQGSKGRI